MEVDHERDHSPIPARSCPQHEVGFRAPGLTRVSGRPGDGKQAGHVFDTNDDVEVPVLSGLFAEERIDPPATIEAHLDGRGFHQVQEFHDSIRCHAGDRHLRAF